MKCREPFAEHHYSVKEVGVRMGGLGQTHDGLVFENLMQKSPLQKIFGSNLSLTASIARGVPISPWSFIPDARQRASENLKGLDVVPLYELARTYFRTKC